MSKLKTIALAAGFTALSGNALARETPAESRDSVSTTTETVIQNQPERKTYAISDKTLRFRTIRDEVKNTQYASKSLNNDGTVFIGVQENGQQESRSVILTKEYGAVGIRKIGDKTLISNKLGDFFHDNTICIKQWTFTRLPKAFPISGRLTNASKKPSTGNCAAVNGENA